jgi:RES domain-containing protein
VDKLLEMLLGVGSLSSLRHDDSVARQGVMNHQTSAHLLDLTIARDATEMSIPESYAIQGLSLSHTPREAVATNLASGTPKS